MVTRTAGPTSNSLLARATSRIPGGVNSNIRLGAPPVFFQRGKGAWLWDVDGNDYIDYLLGQGPAFLGHANERVDRAVHEATSRGMVYGAQHTLEVEAAERICSALGWADMVRLGMTGTEVVQAALRLARATTGRRKFVRFEGHYHGWLDNVLVTTDGDRTGPASDGQVAQHLDDCYVLPWNDAEGLAELLGAKGDDVAAVIMEPVMLNTGSIEPRRGYLQRVRELCTTYGVLLIFDEVISGFRLALGGAAATYHVAPDLATYGKAMAGGWPVAALAGRGDLMERFGDGSVNHAGTFNGSVMAAAAVCATLDILVADPPYERVASYGKRLIAGLESLGEKHGLPLRIQGPPMAFHASFGPPGNILDQRDLSQLDLGRYARWARVLAGCGVWVAGRGVWYVSDAHGADELATTLERADQALGLVEVVRSP